MPYMQRQGSSYSDRPQGGRGSFSSGGQSRGGQGRGGFQHRSAFGGQSNGPRVNPRQKRIDPRLFVRKAIDLPEVVAFIPTNTFESFQLDPQLQKNIAKHGYTSLTSIQDQSIPHLLAGKDVVGIANTGTGKTAAFLIPLIQKIALDRTQRVLIVAPTRELAVQIEDECMLFSQNMGIATAVCIGGMGMYGQVQRLRRRPHFVIGTPGRLRDLEREGVLRFSAFHTIVLDEVDQMLDMGFVRDIQHIAETLPKDRQTLFFSATLPSSVQGVMREFLTNPVHVAVKSHATADNVDQDIIKINGRAKIDILQEMLEQTEFEKVLIFLRTKRGTEKLAQTLYDRGVRVVAIHGNKSQNQRLHAIDQFKRNRTKVLLATDIASRGLDIDSITHVINFDLPDTYEDYVHRIGRTGRASKKGIALTFID